MRWLLVPVAGVGCTLAATPWGPLRPWRRQDQRPPFRSGVRTVAVYTTVRDPDGRLAPDLTKGDFDTFPNDTLPFTAVLLLDMTGSIGKSFYRVRAAAQRFVQTLLPEDRIRIGTFGEEVSIDSAPPHRSTRNPTMALRSVLDRLHHVYALDIVPPTADDRRHHVVVRVKKPDMRVTARKAYAVPGRDSP